MLTIERYFFYRGKSAPILMSKNGGLPHEYAHGERGFS